MAYPVGQTVSDVKKVATDFKSNLNSGLKAGVKDMTGETKSASTHGSSIAETVISSVASMIPVKNADEALGLLQSTAEEVQESLMTARDSAASFIKKYPFYSLLAAGVIGAGAFMLLSPRKSTSARLH